MIKVMEGFRVLELAQFTFVPAAGAILADWGADVIKVESVGSGDPGRALVIGGFTRKAARADTDFIVELSNRGKRGIALDLKNDTGREIFGRLLAQADVLLTNWLPAALERAGLGVEDIRAFNPSIIIARGTGLGVRGPDRNRGGFDAATYLARGGVAYPLTPFGTEHPAVTGAGVVGRPDERHGEEVVAFVSLSRADAVTEPELVEWARRRIGGYKYPREVQIVDAMPLTAVGKLDRKALRAQVRVPAG